MTFREYHAVQWTVKKEPLTVPKGAEGAPFKLRLSGDFAIISHEIPVPEMGADILKRLV